MIKLLLDTCVYGKAKSALDAKGFDVLWAGDWLEDPGDVEILRRAYESHRILVTLDKDFGELAILNGHPHHGIIRITNCTALMHAVVTEQIVAKHSDILQQGAIITYEPKRLRIREPD